MSDKIFNFYDKLGIKGSAPPKTWKKHHMYNKCHTLCLWGDRFRKIKQSGELHFSF